LPSAAAAPRLPPAPAGYQVAAVDFVNPSTGWVVGLLDSGDLTVLHTSDAGRHWARQLSHPSDGHDTFLRFFDERRGMFALIGARPLIYRTADGGRTWRPQVLFSADVFVQSLSFLDPANGWMLISSGPSTQAFSELYRTRDGGDSWTDLGRPAASPDQTYGVQFADATTGWLDSESNGPYAYRSVDAGVTWLRVPLPAPPSGWPPTGQFFVSARPTQGLGVVATVVNFPPAVGRSGLGATITWYPPLTVHTFDGGSPVSYTYTTVITQMTTVPSSQSPAPNQVELGSLDAGATWNPIAPPSDPGAIGYSNARDWWWIGSGAWSRSSDGGATWTSRRNLGVPQPLPGSLQILDPKHAWFAAMAGTSPVLETTADAGVTWRMLLLPVMNVGDANYAG
ncbi:MAG: WD40/YVTN/BNR-like repeat-containing protein, partial [Candidatus Dormibacteraceae bacterium]